MIEIKKILFPLDLTENSSKILPIFKHDSMISFFVFVMMLLVEFVDTASKRRISDIIKGGRWRQCESCPEAQCEFGIAIGATLFALEI